MNSVDSVDNSRIIQTIDMSPLITDRDNDIIEEVVPLDVDYSLNPFEKVSPSCLSIIKKVSGVFFLVLTALSTGFIASSTDSNVTFTTLCLISGSAAFAAFELLADSCIHENAITQINFMLISTIQKLFFGFAEGLRHLPGQSLAKTALSAVLYSTTGAVAVCEVSRIIKKPIADERVSLADPKALYNSRLKANGTAVPLRPLLFEPLTIEGFWKYNFLLPLISSVGLLTATAYVPEPSKDLLIRLSMLGWGIPFGNLAEFYLTMSVRAKEREGVHSRILNVKRASIRLGGQIAGVVWASLFVFSGTNIGLRIVNGTVIGVSSSYRKRRFIEGFEPEPRGLSPKHQTEASYLMQPKTLLKVNKCWEYLALAGGIAWYSYESYDHSGWASRFAMIESTVALTAGFIFSKAMNFLYSKPTGKLLNTLVYLGLYDVTWLFLPYLFVTRDISRIDSVELAVQDTGSRSYSLLAADAFVWGIWSFTLGMSLDCETLSPAFTNFSTDWISNQLLNG